MCFFEDDDDVDDKDSQVVPYNEQREDYKKFKYNKLGNLRKHIRLLKLQAGDHRTSNVYCQLFEAVLGDDGVYEMQSDVGNGHTNTEPRRIDYEALSWCWPQDDKPKHQVLIHADGQVKRKRASEELVWALKYLRSAKKDRILWIDAICINQEHTPERNHQVENMAKIYSFATRVCVWLGRTDNSSKLAIKFIKDEIMQLQNFDDLCANDNNAEKWRSLLSLMQRRWFSRRWVVQEIALAHSAMIYCGPDRMRWKDFAVAVELFVEVETATHRLSEVMQKDPKFYHVPGWFEYVSELGASLLVQATGKVFRDRKAGDNSGNRAVENTSRRPLLSLEYLVSTLPTFDVTEPRDVVYSLLAIAKDTIPFAVTEGVEDPHVKTQRALEHWTERKRYVVDYKRSYPEVCKDFIKFCIGTSEPSRAVDIICRPWAPEPKPYYNPQTGTTEEVAALPSWVPQLSEAPFAMFPSPGSRTRKMARKNADALVGMPMISQRNYNAALTKGIDLDSLTWRDRTKLPTKPHFSMYIKGFILDTVTEVTSASQNGAIPEEWLRLANWDPLGMHSKDEPPPDFWRTLVADRGRDGRNPPVYYAKACKESVIKGGVAGGAVNTLDLIHNERNSIIAQFCRRVQAVIWNRSLIKTEHGHLGLANKHTKVGDKICILYGCSVPVILRQCSQEKSKEQIQIEMEYDRKQAVEKALKAGKRRLERLEKRKERYREMCEASDKFQDKLQREERQIDKLSNKEKEKLFWKEEVPKQTRDLAERLEAEWDDKVMIEFEDWLRMQSRKNRRASREQDHFRRVQTQPLNGQPGGAPGQLPNQPHAEAPGPRHSGTADTNGDALPNRTAERSTRPPFSQMTKEERERAIKESEWRRGERKKASLKRKATVEQILDDHRIGKRRITEGNKKAQPSREDDKWYYTFLGECYIHGMMDGEAIGHFNRNELRSHMFELR